MVRSRDQAAEIVNDLKGRGFSNDEISALFPDKGGSRDFAHTHETKAPEGATVGASTGGLVGGALGWLAGIGSLAIPGLGPFIAAGPIMAALGGAAVGGAAGGVTGALIGYGMPEYEAKIYEGKIRDGNILLSVHTESKEELKAAEEVFSKHGAEDVSSTSEESPPKA